MGGAKTIGVLADYMNASGSAYEAHIRDAIDARCRERGHNLIVVYGRALEDPAPASVPHNAIFNRLTPEIVDGILLISSCLAALSGVEGLQRLAGRCQPFPLCSIGIEVPGVPSVVADNAPGMARVLEHLIVEHGCRKIAFIAGIADNPEAKIRFEVYRDILERHGVGYDPNLIGYGAFAKEHAHKAIEAMLRQGVSPDAVVAANDAMAAGVIQALRETGRRVPRDILVTGYDDMPFARLGNPPLTTVRQPLEAMAATAVDLLLDQIAGQPVPACTKLATEMVVRRSCGCQRHSHTAAAQATTGVRPLAVDYVAEHAAELRGVLVNGLKSGSCDPTSDAALLLEGLLSELRGQAGSFLRAVEELLEQISGNHDRGRALQLALMALRHELHECATLELEAIWYEAATTVALANGTSPALDRLITDEHTFVLMGAAEQISMALDLPELQGVLACMLPQLGVRTAFLATYADANESELVPLACLETGNNITLQLPAYPARQLLPCAIGGDGQRRTLLVYPLAYDGQALGIAAFEYEDKSAGYNALVAQISAALRKIALHEQILRKTMLHDRSVQERVATAKRLEALSVLAGGVAHDLNNALSPMLALSDVILTELSRLEPTVGAQPELIADVEAIRAASLHAAQTIKDLLTLGRQGRLVKHALDLNAVVDSTVLRSVRDAHPRVKLSQQLSDHPLVVLGSEAQLERAIANLLHNALDAVSGSGQLWISTDRVVLTEPCFAYERIEPGEYAVLSIADDGMGIASAQLAHIFEPFFSKKRASERAGSGLGLAIVHGVVKEHAGYVDVTSVPGQGTKFSLYIPITHQPVYRSMRPISVRPGKGRILLVDDDPLLLRTCSRVLKPLGYELVTSDSGQQSLDELVRVAATGSCPYDLVVIDMVLNEELDGLQLFERIHDLFPGLKAIIASGHAASERVEQAVARGLAWLPKPYTADALARAVQEALDG